MILSIYIILYVYVKRNTPRTVHIHKHFIIKLRTLKKEYYVIYWAKNKTKEINVLLYFDIPLSIYITNN